MVVVCLDRFHFDWASEYCILYSLSAELLKNNKKN